jgi:hypothetical protein
MGTIVKLRGEGSVVWEFELPLSEVFADQVRDRKLVPVDDDSYAAIADLLTGPAGVEAAPADGEQGVEPPVEKPLGEMKLTELIEHAEQIGVDPETLASLRKNGTSKAKAIAAITAKAAE